MFHLISSKPLSAAEVFAGVKHVDNKTFLDAANAVRDASNPLFFVKSALGKRRKEDAAQAVGPSNSAVRALVSAECDQAPVSVAELWQFALME